MVKLKTYLILLLLISLFPVLGSSQDKDISITDAKALYDSGKIDEALSAFEKFYEIYPGDNQICYYYGSCLVRNKVSPEIAIDVLLKASTGEVPSNVFYYLGKAFHLKYKFAEADLNFKKFRKRGNRAEIQTTNIDLMEEMVSVAVELTNNIKRYNLISIETKNHQEELDTILSDVLIDTEIQVMDTKLYSTLDDRFVNRYPFIQSIRDNKIYYSSYGNNGEFGKELYFINNEEIDDKFKPQTPGIVFSTNYAEINPVFTNEGNRMWYCSNGFGSMGGFDVFYSDYNSTTGMWGKPINAGFPINSVYDDYLFIPAKDSELFTLFTNRECDSESYKLIKVESFNADSIIKVKNRYASVSLFDYNYVVRLENENNVESFVFELIDDTKGLSNYEYNFELQKDLNFLKRYNSYLENLIVQSHVIADEKEILSVKKKREAEKMKDANSLYNENGDGESEKSLLLTESQNLEKLSEFINSYINSTELIKTRLNEFVSITEEKLNLDISAITNMDKLIIVNDYRKLANQSLELFTNLDMDYLTLLENLNNGKQSIELNKQQQDTIQNEILTLEKLKVEISESRIHENLKRNKLDEINKEVEKLNIKKKFINSHILKTEEEQIYSNYHLSFIKDFSKDLSLRAVESFDFKKEYNSIEIANELQPEPLYDEAIWKYDFSRVDEDAIITKIDFNEEEIVEIRGTYRKNIDAELLLQKAEEAKAVRNALQKKMRSRKKSRVSSIQKKIKKQDALIFKYELTASQLIQSSFDTKYMLLSDKRNLYKSKRRNGFIDIKIYDDASKKFYAEATELWNGAVERNNTTIEPYNIAIANYDSAYTNLLKLFWVNLNYAPVIPVKEQKINLVSESNIIEEKQSVDYRASMYNPMRKITDYKLFFFTIQLGAFNSAQKLSDFNGISPVFEHIDGKFYKYFAGMYKSKSEANIGRELVAMNGFTDSYVTAFNNGVKISSKEARTIVKSDNLKFEDEAKIVIGSSDTKPIVVIDDRNEKGFYFTVQLSVISDDVGVYDKFDLEPVIAHPYNDKFRITCGRFITYEKAKETKDNLVRKYYPDAYVIAFYKGEQIEINKAKTLSGSGENVIFASPVSVRAKNKAKVLTQVRSVNSEIEYKIQIASFSLQPSNEVVESLEEIAGDYKLGFYINKRGLIVYSVGSFSRYNDALVLRKKLIESGAEEAFIHAFKSGKLIPVNEAIKITD